MSCTIQRGYLVALMLSLSLLCGCGGGSHSLSGGSRKGGTGKLTVSLKWPDAGRSANHSRFIPLASRSVVITVSAATGFTAVSPALTPSGSGSGAVSTYTFNTVPTGTITVAASALPNADGTGTAQASATNPNVSIQADQTANLAMSMDTTISATQSVVFGNSALTRTRTAHYTVTFKDANGNMVLVDPSTVTWDAAAGFPISGDVTVTKDPSDATGLSANATATRAGSVLVRATYSEPGEAIQFPGNPNRRSSASVQVLPIIYICDHDNNNIVEIDDMRGTNRATLPPVGAGYFFNQPQGIAIDSLGGVYVADTGNNRLVRINQANGADLVAVTTANSIPISNPTAVAVDSSNNIYLIDDGNGRILQFSYTASNNTLSYVSSTPIANSGAIHNALLALGSGSFYLTEVSNNTFPPSSPSVILPNGSFPPTFTGSGVVALKYPSGLASGTSYFYIADRDGNQVLQLRGLSSGVITVAATIGSFGGANLSAPRGLAFDGTNGSFPGSLYVADTGNRRIIQTGGDLSTSFGTTNTYGSSTTSELSAPYAIALH